MSAVDNDDDEVDEMLKGEVDACNRMAMKTHGFLENEVMMYGNVKDGSEMLRLLSPLCMVPDGIHYAINGQDAIFDTAEHIHAFLAYGVPSNLNKWVRGGVMSDFRTMFGNEAGGEMLARHGNLIGIIPRLVVKKERAQLRSAHGIEIRETAPGKECVHYDFWRPILFAKFDAPGTVPMDALLTYTGNKYLIDKDGSCSEWSGKISYPTPPHGPDVVGCSCFDDGDGTTTTITDPKQCNSTKMYSKLKRDGARVDGILVGNNRMGKYLMAVRTELRLIHSMPVLMHPPTTTSAEAAPKKRKKN